MRGLIAQSMVFILLNIAIISLINLSSDAIITYEPFKESLDYNTTDITPADIDNLNDYAISKEQLEDAEIPDWLIWIFLLIDVSWLSFIIAGWIRGVE